MGQPWPAHDFQLVPCVCHFTNKRGNDFPTPKFSAFLEHLHVEKNATIGDFYEVVPKPGEFYFHLSRQECGNFCMYRIAFQQMPDGVVRQLHPWCRRQFESACAKCFSWRQQFFRCQNFDGLHSGSAKLSNLKPLRQIVDGPGSHIQGSTGNDPCKACCGRSTQVIQNGFVVHERVNLTGV